MKKITAFILSLILIGSALALAGCSSSGDSSGSTSPASLTSASQTSASQTDAATSAADTSAAASEATAAGTQKVFTVEELKAFDGKDGNPAYVALDGTVYDVTLIAAWLGGEHQGMAAGQDISDKISSSPHGKTVLEQLTVVGTLEG